MLQRLSTPGSDQPSATVVSARAIAREVARPHAVEVDLQARFPVEAVSAMRKAGLLGAAIPREMGGLGASFSDIVSACYELGQECSNAAMVFAMHQIQVACLVRHGSGIPWHRAFLERVAAKQLLLASATTEAGSAGDVRRSHCAVVPVNGKVKLVKEGCVISYAANCDGVLITARRNADAAANDQVLLVAERGQCSLKEMSTWDTLGMRGTDSRTYHLTLEAEQEQVLPVSYADVSAQTMLPVSHVTWSAAWLGIATGACGLARRVLLDRARRTPGLAPSGAPRLSEALAGLQYLRANVAEAVKRYDRAIDDADRLASVSFVLAMNALKIGASTQAVQIIGQAMLVVGLAAYRNDSPYSLGRHLRDAHSAALMIGNDRILGNSATLLSAYRTEEPLFAC